MNEQAIQEAYNLFVSGGYGDSIDDFKSLILQNEEALQVSYDLFVERGYTDSIDDFKVLMGVTTPSKKKDTTGLSLEDGSLVLPESYSEQDPFLTPEREEFLKAVAEQQGVEYVPPKPPKISDVEVTPYAEQVFTEPIKDVQSARAPKGIKRTAEVKLPQYDSPSTVLMAHYGDYSPPEAKGKYVAFPTIFPKDPNNQTSNIKDWIIAENEDEAYEIAKKRGEVLYYDTQEEAASVAAGSWKSSKVVNAQKPSWMSDEEYEEALRENPMLLANLPKVEELSEADEAKGGEIFFDTIKRKVEKLEELSPFEQEGAMQLYREGAFTKEELDDQIILATRNNRPLYDYQKEYIYNEVASEEPIQDAMNLKDVGIAEQAEQRFQREKEVEQRIETEEAEVSEKLKKQEEDADAERLASLEGIDEDLNFLSSDFLSQSEEQVVPELNEKLGKYGIVFSEAIAGTNAVKMVSPTGETETIGFGYTDEQKAEAIDAIKSFVKGGGEKPRELTSIAKEASDYVRSQGFDFDYNQQIEIAEAYEELEEDLNFIEQGIPYSLLTKEEKERFGKYYSGNYVSVSEEIKSKMLNNLSELDRQFNKSNFFSENNYRRARNEYDEYIERKLKSISASAARTNDAVQETINNLEQTSQEVFGVSLNELQNIKPKNQEEARIMMDIGLALEKAKQDYQNAATLYESANTYYDAKVEKKLQVELADNLEAFTESFTSALNTNRAGRYLLYLQLGLPMDTPLEEVAGYLEKAQNAKVGRALWAFQNAKTFAGKMEVFKNDPFEMISSVGVQMIGQMLPYWKEIVATTAGGAAIGSATGTPLGTLSGGVQGFRISQAAINAAVEYTNVALDAMRKYGYNPTDTKSLEKAINDSRVWDMANDVGLKRAAIIMGVDYLSSGVAGRVVKVGTVASRGRKIAAKVGETLIYQPFEEGLGEYLAQVGSGQDVNWTDVYLESIGGPFTSTPMMVLNTYVDSKRETNRDIAKNLMDIDFISKEISSNSRISTWANNMERLGQISAEENQIIQENVGLREEARDLLGVGMSTRFKPKKTIALESRVMKLLSAKEQLSSTANRRSVFSKQISDINAELEDVATNKKLRDKGEETNLAAIGIADRKERVGLYKIKGKEVSKQEFLDKVRTTPVEELDALNPEVRNDTESKSILDELFTGGLKSVQEQFQELDNTERQRFIDDPTRGYSFEYESEQDVPIELQSVDPISKSEIQVNGTTRIRLTFSGQQLIDAGLANQTTESTTSETQRGVEILALPEPITRPTKKDKAAFENNTLEPERLDGILSAIVDKQLGNKKLTPFQQQVAEASQERLEEVVSSKTLEQETRELEEVLALPEAEVTEEAAPAAPVEVAKQKITYGISEAFDIEEKILESIPKEKDVFYHGSPNIEWTTSENLDINTELNTRNAPSKYLFLAKKPETALSYSIEKKGGVREINKESGIAVFKIKKGAKVYKLTSEDIKGADTIDKLESIYDNIKDKGYDVIVNTLDGDNRIILNNDVIEYKSTHKNQENIKQGQPKVDFRMREEETQLASDIETYEMEIEDLQNEIEIEKGNLKEGLAELDAKIKEVRQSKRNRATKAELIEELKGQKQDLKDDQNGLIDSYKEDIKALKADTRKAQRRIKKLEGQRQPKVDFRMREEGQFVPIADEVREITDVINQQESGNVGTNLDETVEGVTIDVANINERTSQELPSIATLQIIDGIPTIFTISDQLTVGTAVNPQTGTTIENLKGGLGFNGTQNNENTAWANTTEKEAADLLQKALQVYEANKPTYEEFWAANPEINGLVPMAVVKMGEGSILSNEATFRVLQDNLTKIPRENRVNAMNALRESVQKARDTKQAAINKGNLTDTSKKNYLKEIAGYDAMLQLFQSQRVESIDDVVTNEFISFLSLPARRRLIEQITYGQPQRVGAKKKPSKGNKVVPNVLMEGLDKESFTLIHLGPITDVITEPTLENVPQRHIIGLVGVDVLNPEVITDVDHPNYQYGLKGKTIGILENPVSITRAFPQAYQNAVAGLVAEEKKGKVITEKQRKRATKAERETMPEVGELAPSSVESILMQTVGVQIGLPGLEFIGALAQSNLPNVFKLTSFMNVAFPNVNISTDMNTFNNVIESDGVRVYLKGDEIIYGVTVDGDVYINPDVHNSKSEVFNTAIHEMGHVWTDYLQTSAKGRTIYKKGVDLVKQTKEYQKQLKRFNGDSQKAANETMAILIGNKGQTIADASLKSKFKEWLLGMWKYIKSQFKQTQDLTEEEIQNLTLDEFIGSALADIFAGKEIKLTDAQLKQLKNPDAAFSMNLSMDAIIKRGRANGFSDASIREVLKSRGFKAADINQALEYRVDLFTAMPREFERIEGGIQQASKLFNDLRTELNKWSTSGRRNIIGKRRVKTFAEIRQKAMELMKEHPIYQAQNDQVQMEIMSAFDRSLGYRVNASVQKEISAIRNNLRQRKIGEKNLREAQIRLKNFIRNSLPKSGIYSQGQINRLTKMITETNLDNFEAQALKVMEIVEQQREKIRQVRLKEIYKIVKTKAKPAMTKTGKRRAAGLDAIGQETFAAIKPVMDAVLKNDLEALEKINAFLNENANEINEALDKYTRGEQLRTKESRLLAQQLAYDSFAELSTASLEEVELLLSEVKKAKKESILRFKTRRLKRAADAKAVADLVTEQIEETNPALFDENGNVLDVNERDDVADNIRESLQKFKLKEAYQQIRGSFFKTKAGQQITAFKNWFRHLGTLTNLLDKVTEGKTMFTDYIYRRLNRADEMYNAGLFETKEKLNNIAKQAGIDGGMRGVDILLHGIGLQQLQVIRSKTGRERLTYLNGDQLLRIYALSKNPIQAQKLAEQGITEEVISDIATILGPEITTYADGVVDFLSNEYYEGINEVYAAVNNINLGFVENYFPTRTVQSKVNSKLLDDGDFNGIFNAETSPAFKERVDKKSDIQLKAGDFTSILNDHIQAMEKYKAFAETSQQLNDFFRVEAVDALLEVTGLKKAVKGAINFAINPMSGKNASGLESGILESIQSKFTSFALAFKLVQIPKQASSFFNAYEEYSYFPPNSRVPKVIQSGVDTVMFMVDAARVLGSMALDLVGKNGAIHQAMDMSATFRKRIEQGLEGDVYGLESGSQTFKPLDKSMSKVARARRALRTGAASPTIIGDVMGVMGYMINYKRNIANGMGQAEALEAFNNYNATQQSRRGADKIPLQYSNNALVRGFTMFGSTLFLQINKVMSSATNMSRSIAEGKMPRKQDIRAFYLNLAIANVLFVGVSNMMMFIKGDDEDREAALDKMRDAMLGLNLLYQIPYAGAMFESLDLGERLEALVAGKEYKKKRKMVDDVVNPFTSISFKVNRLMKENGWSGIIRPIAELVMGVQLDPFIGMFNKAMKPEDLLEFDENMYDILGISKSYRPEDYSDEEFSDEEFSDEEFSDEEFSGEDF